MYRKPKGIMLSGVTQSATTHRRKPKFLKAIQNMAQKVELIASSIYTNIIT